MAKVILCQIFIIMLWLLTFGSFTLVVTDEEDNLIILLQGWGAGVFELDLE